MTTQTIAFLGATGDCAGWALADVLNAGEHRCRALARNPEKLLASMRQKGVSSETLNDKLTIVQGNAKQVEDVKKVLADDGEVVDRIVYGIGGALKLRFHINPFTLDDPNICESSMATILSALTELKPTRKPYLIAVSTTGISPGPRDVPLVIHVLYWCLFGVMHDDKHKMEELVRDELRSSNTESCISGYTFIRASLLFDGESAGLEKVRVGTQQKPSVGYNINRRDVGLWMFKNLLQDGGVPAQWKNEAATLTY